MAVPQLLVENHCTVPGGRNPTMEERMRSFKLLAAGVFSGAVLLTTAAANAKGPGGGGAPTHTPGVPQGQGMHGGTWTSPPGWSQGDKTGWNGATVPAGFDNGSKTGWSTTTLPPGIQKKE
jgi:hypothetical protein